MRRLTFSFCFFFLAVVANAEPFFLYPPSGHIRKPPSLTYSLGDTIEVTWQNTRNNPGLILWCTAEDDGQKNMAEISTGFAASGSALIDLSYPPEAASDRCHFELKPGENSVNFVLKVAGDGSTPRTWTLADLPARPSPKPNRPPKQTPTEKLAETQNETVTETVRETLTESPTESSTKKPAPISTLESTNSPSDTPEDPSIRQTPTTKPQASTTRTPIPITGSTMDTGAMPTPTPTPTSATLAGLPAPPDEQCSGLSTGAKAGMGVGIGFGVLALAGGAVAFVILRRRRKTKEDPNAVMGPQPAYYPPPPKPELAG